MTEMSGAEATGAGVETKLVELSRSRNPRDGKEVGETFHQMTETEIETMLTRANEAFKQTRKSTHVQRADALNRIADLLEERKPLILAMAEQETCYPISPRLEGEFGRMVYTIRGYAKMLEKGPLEEYAVCDENSERLGLPFGKPDIVSKQVPLGTIYVNGSSNFPFAFGVGGTDTIAALATGNTVIGKGHSSHRNLSKLVAECIQEGLLAANFPEGTFAEYIGSGKVAENAIIMDPRIRCVTLTGSRRVSDQMQAAINRRSPDIIPLYSENGSINPVLIFPGVLEADPKSIAQEMFNSNTLCGGLFCTNPGMIIVSKCPKGDEFIVELTKMYEESSYQLSLNKRMASDYAKAVDAAKTKGANVIGINNSLSGATEFQTQPTLLQVLANDLFRHPEFTAEMFGPAAVIVQEEADKIPGLATNFEGQLTFQLYGNEADKDLLSAAEEAIESKAGKFNWNTPSVGVDVCRTVHHKGPYPATSLPAGQTCTSVGFHGDTHNRFTETISHQNRPAWMDH